MIDILIVNKLEILDKLLPKTDPDIQTEQVQLESSACRPTAHRAATELQSAKSTGPAQRVHRDTLAVLSF